MKNSRATYVEVQAAPSGSTTILVVWTLTDTSISEQVTSYAISWNGESEDEYGTDSVNSSSSQYSINSLVPCSAYSITVQPTAVSDPLGDPGQVSASTAIQGKEGRLKAMTSYSIRITVNDTVDPRSSAASYMIMSTIKQSNIHNYF